MTSRAFVLLVSSALAFGLPLVLGGCVSPHVLGDNQPVGEDNDASLQAFDALDLLFVVDNTLRGPNPMELFAFLPDVTRALLSGDVDKDGDTDFRAIRSLQVAVVTTDMGAPGITGLPDCGDDTGSPHGDDGVFFSGRQGLVFGDHVCEPGSGFLSLSLPASDTARAAFDDGLACASLPATGGCGYRMPLEAALKSTWDRDDGTVTFWSGGGHGISLQPGFVRAGALLAIVVITTGDDCSSTNVMHLTPAESLAPGDPMASVGRGSRCVRYEDHLHPIGRYEEAFARLKRGALSDVFFGVIGGIPSDFAAELRDQRIERARLLAYKRLLDDPRMQNVIDPESPSGEDQLTPVCGDATPSRRLVELARRFEDLSDVASICDPMEVSLNSMTKAIARRIDPATTL